MTAPRAARRDLDATWSYLEQLGFAPPRRNGRPYVPKAMPSFDDETLGFEFFRTKVLDTSFAVLTLPRTFIGRSLLERVDFRDTDLRESRLCWNDFVDCDFSGADLRGADLRGSTFTKCRFERADLRDAELRNSSFNGSDFRAADVRGAHVRRLSAVLTLLTHEQRLELKRAWFDAEEPGGG